MARKKSSSKPGRVRAFWGIVAQPWRVVRRWLILAAKIIPAVAILLVILLRFVNPPSTLTILAETWRLGGVDRKWVPIEEIEPAVLRAVVAAEDANFCTHWGFDMQAIRAAIDEGARRGGSTITQQTVKNVFLWQGRSWPRKAIEAVLTPLVELLWPKRRVLEVYVNVAEFGEGVFGVGAAAQTYFKTDAAKLTAQQGARLAVVLPNPKERRPDRLPTWLTKRAAQVADGAATIKNDGRSACFDS